MSKITTIVVDDESLARQRILDLLAQDSDVELLAECADGYAAVDTILDQAPDLVFLDVQMPEVNGLQVVDRVTLEQMPLTIFVTAYDQHAVQAFEVHALDYLLKPFDDQRFRQALQRAKTEIQLKQKNQFHKRLMHMVQDDMSTDVMTESNNQPTATDRFLVKVDDELLVINASKIDYIQGEGVYVRLHMGNRSCLVRERLVDWETRLNPQLFCRIHRSTIVNLDRIEKLIPHFRGDYLVVLQDGTQLKLSRSRRDHLQALL